ncbi:hypothetical protein SAMN05443373_108147, partial [Flavobacterium granuli]
MAIFVSVAPSCYSLQSSSPNAVLEGFSLLSGLGGGFKIYF